MLIKLRLFLTPYIIYVSFLILHITPQLQNFPTFFTNERFEKNLLFLVAGILSSCLSVTCLTYIGAKCLIKLSVTEDVELDPTTEDEKEESDEYLITVAQRSDGTTQTQNETSF